MKNYYFNCRKWFIFPGLLICLQLVGCAGVFVQEELPTISHVHIGHAQTGWKHTPGQKGLFNVAEDKGMEALSEANTAQKEQNANEVKKHVKKMMLAVSPQSIKEDDDGYGLINALDDAVSHITFAAESDDASQNVIDFAKKFEKDAEEVADRSTLIVALAQEILASTSKIEITALTDELVKLNKDNVYGNAVQGELGLVQLRTSLDLMVSKEDPPYEPVATRYLFGLIRLPTGKWAFSWLTGDDSFSVRGY